MKALLRLLGRMEAAFTGKDKESESVWLTGERHAASIQFDTELPQQVYIALYNHKKPAKAHNLVLGVNDQEAFIQASDKDGNIATMPLYDLIKTVQSLKEK